MLGLTIQIYSLASLSKFWKLCLFYSVKTEGTFHDFKPQNCWGKTKPKNESKSKWMKANYIREWENITYDDVQNYSTFMLNCLYRKKVRCWLLWRTNCKFESIKWIWTGIITCKGKNSLYKTWQLSFFRKINLTVISA